MFRAPRTVRRVPLYVALACMLALPSWCLLAGCGLFFPLEGLTPDSGVLDSRANDAVAFDSGTVDSKARDSAARDSGPRDAGEGGTSEAASDACLQSPATAVPGPALGAGYTCLTFGPLPTIGSSPGTWQDGEFYGVPSPGAWGDVMNVDGGALYLPGSTTESPQACTAAQNNEKPPYWQGMAFGGGFYVEALLKYDPVAVGDAAPNVPLFSAQDIETLSVNAVGSQSQWPGQDAGYGEWLTVTIMKRDNPTSYTVGFDNYYGYFGPTVHQTAFAMIPPVTLPGARTFLDENTFGFLWVPATSTTQGYGQWFLNGTMVAGVTWNAYDPDASPPLDAGTAFSVMDTRHLVLILGTGLNYPMTVYRVSVWQKDASNNEIQ